MLAILFFPLMIGALLVLGAIVAAVVVFAKWFTSEK
jgi:hypothetical protein